MFQKKNFQWTSVILILIILMFVIYLVTYNGPSPVVTFFQWMSTNLEGFEVMQSNSPHCPTNYRFFNDTQGESMCCKGKVDPYTHTCLSNAELDLCAFIPGIKDHRKINGAPLPVCKDLIQKLAEQMEKDHCPKSLPNHAASGKCCRNPSDSLSGDCMPHDLSDPKASCLVTLPKNIIYKQNGHPGNYDLYNKTTKQFMTNTKMCDQVKLFETAKCPKDTFSLIEESSKMPFCLPTRTTWSESELKRLKDLKIDETGMSTSCFPEKVFEYFKQKIKNSQNKKLYDPPMPWDVDLENTRMDIWLSSITNCTNLKKIIVDGDNTLLDKIKKKSAKIQEEYKKRSEKK